MSRPRVLSIVLAGGEGKRLAPLTLDRAKPAVPFGGVYRLIDFVLSNLVNADYRRIVVLTQYKSHSLDVHVSRTWPLSTLLGNYVTTVPAQMRRGPHWFAGSADAIYQNYNLLRDERPDYVIVFGADHIYRMDPRQMVEQHIASGAGVTVAGIRVPIEQANQFGVLEMGDGRTISRFREKPTEVEGLADDPSMALLSEATNPHAADTGFFANPKGPYGHQHAALGGQGISIVSYSQNQEEAMKFLEWFIQDDVQKRWAELGGYTAHAKTLESEEFRSATPYNEAFYQTMFVVKDFWAVPEFAELLTQLNNRIYPFVVGDEGTAQEVLDALAEDWKATFARYGRGS